MAFAIWKIALSVADVQDIEVPAGAQLLTAREQHGKLCVWFKCNPDRPMVKRRIAILGTGHAAPDDDARYVGTGFFSDGALVLHVFERIEDVVGGEKL